MDVQRLVIAALEPLPRSVFVRDGRVACPRQGDVDIDACATCDYLEWIEGDRVGCRFRPARGANVLADLFRR